MQEPINVRFGRAEAIFARFGRVGEEVAGGMGGRGVVEFGGGRRQFEGSLGQEG